MTDKKDGPGKGPERPAEPQGSAPGSKRPFATIDLKATEVKADDAKARQGEPRSAAPASEAGTAAKIVAAAKATAATAVPPTAGKPENPAKPADPREAPAGDRKPAHSGASWSVDDALADRHVKSEMPGAGALAAVDTGRPSGIGRFLSHAVAGVLGGALALAGGQHLLPLIGIEPPRQQAAVPASPALPTDVADRIAGLEKTLRERLVTADAPRPNPALDQGLARIEDLQRRLAALAEAQSKLDAENTALREQIAQRPAAADAVRLQKLEEQLATIAAAAQAAPDRAGRIPQLAQLSGQVRDLEAALQSRLTALRRDMTQEIETRVAPGLEAGEAAKAGALRLDREVAGVKSEATRLATRLDQLKIAADKLDEIVRGLKDEAGTLKAAVDGFKADVDGRLKAAAKPGDVAAAVTPLQQKLAELERSLVGIVRAEDDRKSNTERIVLSLELGNLKRAMERGARYTTELAEVRRVAGDRIDLKALERYQNDGVPTLAALTQDFRRVANAIIDAEAEVPGASVVDRMMTSAKTIVRVRKAEYAATDVSAEAVVTRMEGFLKDGRLADLLAEAARLTGKARAPAAEWLRQLEARQVVDTALSAIDTALKSSLGAGPRPDAPAVTPPAAKATK